MDFIAASYSKVARTYKVGASVPAASHPEFATIATVLCARMFGCVRSRFEVSAFLVVIVHSTLVNVCYGASGVNEFLEISQLCRNNAPATKLSMMGFRWSKCGRAQPSLLAHYTIVVVAGSG